MDTDLSFFVSNSCEVYYACYRVVIVTVGVGMGVGVGVASVLYNRQVNKLRMCFLYSNTVLYSCMLQESDLISLKDCLAAFSLLDIANKSGTTVLDYGIRAFCIIPIA